MYSIEFDCQFLYDSDSVDVGDIIIIVCHSKQLTIHCYIYILYLDLNESHFKSINKYKNKYVRIYNVNKGAFYSTFFP